MGGEGGVTVGGEVVVLRITSTPPSAHPCTPPQQVRRLTADFHKMLTRATGQISGLSAANKELQQQQEVMEEQQQQLLQLNIELSEENKRLLKLQSQGKILEEEALVRANHELVFEVERLQVKEERWRQEAAGMKEAMVTLTLRVKELEEERKEENDMEGGNVLKEVDESEHEMIHEIRLVVKEQEDEKDVNKKLGMRGRKKFGENIGMKKIEKLSENEGMRENKEKKSGEVREAKQVCENDGVREVKEVEAAKALLELLEQDVVNPQQDASEKSGVQKKQEGVINKENLHVNGIMGEVEEVEASTSESCTPEKKGSCVLGEREARLADREGKVGEQSLEDLFTRLQEFTM